LNKQYISTLREILNQKRNIIIISHANPDGDAIGSSLALYNYFLLKNHNVNVIVPNQFPDFLAWMPGSDAILTYNTKESDCEKLIDAAELIFFLDFNALNRIDKLEDVVRKASAKTILIDHHLQADIKNFDFPFSIINVSSTGELIFDFISAMGDEALINADIAACIYVGIMTDTGSYSYSCNYEKTYNITASLIKAGVDAEEVHHLVYDTFSENRLRLLGYSLSEKLTVNSALSTAYITLSKEELDRFNYQVGDTEGVVNYALSMGHINLAALFTERDGKVRISFRSKGEVDVNVFARAYFNGGGHKHAAGATSHISLDETIQKFQKSIVEFFASK
jgi:bifunctional oligoribonuclease and PAP phosphatase NrnA